MLPYFAVILVNAVKVRGTPDDPNYFVPEPKVAITEAPFSGDVIAARGLRPRDQRHNRAPRVRGSAP